MSTLVSYVLDDGVATITIDDGKANVMSVPMLRAIAGALDSAEADEAVVVIRGRAGMFSGGFDLTVFKRDKHELFAMLKAGAELTERVLSFPYPVVAVCTGHAIAMGVFLLLSADLRIGTKPDAKMQVNEVAIGLTLPHFAIEVCRQRLSPAHVTVAAVLATSYDQQEALAAGFLDEVVQPELAAELLATRLAHLRTLHMASFAATKLRFRGPTLALLRTAIAQDIQTWSQRFATDA